MKVHVSASGCEEVLWWLTWVFEQRDVQDELRRLRETGAGVESSTEILLSHLGPNEALAREELREFPSMTVPLLLDAWDAAVRAGVPFAVRSVRPDRPIEYARRKRITLTVVVDDDAIEVQVAHVAGHHATWLSPEPTAAASRSFAGAAR